MSNSHSTPNRDMDSVEECWLRPYKDLKKRYLGMSDKCRQKLSIIKTAYEVVSVISLKLNRESGIMKEQQSELLKELSLFDKDVKQMKYQLRSMEIELNSELAENRRDQIHIKGYNYC